MNEDSYANNAPKCSARTDACDVWIGMGRVLGSARVACGESVT